MGATPDLNIDLQRAIFVLEKPIALDFAKSDEIVSRNGFTLGGVHVRVRGKFVENGIFEVRSTGQRVTVENPQPGTEIVATVPDWKNGDARWRLLSAK